MSPIDSYEYVFPVLGVVGEGPNKDLREVCGTVFPIGGGVSLTPAHVLARALSVRLV